jgi:hypothetical protein
VGESDMNYTFSERFDFSTRDIDEINVIYKNEFGDGIKIKRYLPLERERNGIDLEIILPNGERKTVQEKKRSKMYQDILIEYCSQFNQNTQTCNKPGWIYEISSDYLVYLFPNKTAKFYPTVYLKNVWDKHGNRWKDLADRQADGFRLVQSATTSKDGKLQYLSLNVAVPTNIINREIEKELNRNRITGGQQTLFGD